MSRVSEDDIDQFIAITQADYRTAYYFISHNPGDLNNAINAFLDIGAEAVPIEFRPPDLTTQPANTSSRSTVQNSNEGGRNSENTSRNRTESSELSGRTNDTHYSQEQPDSRRISSGVSIETVLQAVIGLLGESENSMLSPPPNIILPPPSIPPESTEIPEENSLNSNEASKQQPKENLPTFHQYKFQKSTFHKERLYNEEDIKQAFIQLKNEPQQVEESNDASNTEKIYPTFDKSSEILQNPPQNSYKQINTTKNNSILKRRYKATNHTAITIWKNGYSIKGKFTELDEEKYKEFMNQINTGNIPTYISGDDFEIIDKKSFDFST